MNEKPLSPREHDELRGSVVSGLTRMRAARARRMQVAGAAGAVVVIAAVVTAVLAGTIRAPQNTPVVTPTPTQTQTSSPSPTPSPSPTETVQPPAAAVSAFGGDCASVIDTGLLSDVLGAQMEVYPLLWPDAQVSLAGGLDCVWREPDQYMIPSFSVLAYPATIGQPEFPVSCDGVCSATVVAGGTWLSISAMADGLDAPAMQRLVDEVVKNVAGYQPPRSAERDAGWWTLPACDALSAGVDGSQGLEIVAQAGSQSGDAQTDAIWAATRNAVGPYLTACTWNATVGAAAANGVLDVIPGGASSFDAIAASDGAEPLAVPGAEAAVGVRPNDRWEGYGQSLVIKDGENLLIIRVYSDTARADLAPLVQPLLAFLD